MIPLCAKHTRMHLPIVALAAALATCTLPGCASHAKMPTARAAVPAPAISGHTAPQTAPIYPGATRKAAGKNARVSTYVTKDPFGRVYAWYRSVLPPGAEKTHSLAPPQTAFFVTGDPGDQQTITLNAVGKSTAVVVALHTI